MANEKRLIDANALLARLASSSESWAKNLKAIRNWWPHAVGIKDNIVGVINDMPTVDAVEVVRCKDCKYYEDVKLLPHCTLCGIMKCEDDFCSCGERKEQ